MLATTKFNLRAISESMKSDYSTATALANYLVKVEGISFRESHAVVGELVKISIEEGVPFEETVVKRMPEVVSRLTKTGKRAKGIERDTLGELLDPGRFLAAIVTPGGSNPSFIPAELADRTEVRRRNRAAVSDLRASLATSENLLREAVVSAAGAARGKKREVKS
jgi:argininosuccinate lyase